MPQPDLITDTLTGIYNKGLSAWGVEIHYGGRIVVGKISNIYAEAVKLQVVREVADPNDPDGPLPEIKNAIIRLSSIDAVFTDIADN